jgi:hypothetical protein
MKTKEHKTKNGDTLNDKQYDVYRADYQASWERDRYKSDEDYRTYKKEKSKVRYESMSDEDKEGYLTYLKEYREGQFDNMSKPEQIEYKAKRSQYHKKRRDAKIVGEAKTKFKSLSDLKKEKYLEKLFRYQRICNDPSISAELTKWVNYRFDGEELEELGFTDNSEVSFKFNAKTNKSVSKAGKE